MDIQPFDPSALELNLSSPSPPQQQQQQQQSQPQSPSSFTSSSSSSSTLQQQQSTFLPSISSLMTDHSSPTLPPLKRRSYK